MQARERVLRVFELDEPDVLPVLFRAMDGALQREFMNLYEPDENDVVICWRDLTPLIGLKLDAFDFRLPPRSTKIDIGSDSTVDAFGRILKKGNYATGYITSQEILDSFLNLQLENEQDPVFFKKMVDLAGDRIAIFCCLNGIFENTWEGMGITSFARALRKDRHLINSVLDRNFNFLQFQVNATLDAGIEFFSIADDMGFKNGPFTALSLYEQEIFPRYRPLIQLIHKKGGLVYLHSEGNITELMPNIISSGFDGIQGLTPLDGIDLAQFKIQFGDKIALFGGLSHSPLLDLQSSKEVKTAVRQAFYQAGSRGGFMIGPSAAVDKHCKLANVLTFIETAHECFYR